MRRIYSPFLYCLLWYVVILFLRTSPESVFNNFILFKSHFFLVIFSQEFRIFTANLSFSFTWRFYVIANKTAEQNSSEAVLSLKMLQWSQIILFLVKEIRSVDTRIRTFKYTSAAGTENIPVASDPAASFQFSLCEHFLWPIYLGHICMLPPFWGPLTDTEPTFQSCSLYSRQSYIHNICNPKDGSRSVLYYLQKIYIYYLKLEPFKNVKIIKLQSFVFG